MGTWGADFGKPLATLWANLASDLTASPAWIACVYGNRWRIGMKYAKLVAAAALLIAAAFQPQAAEARRHHHHYGYHWGLPYPISYLHNYGPGLEPGTFAYYDGPSTNLCYRGSATYIGQDGRRHPCF